MYIKACMGQDDIWDLFFKNLNEGRKKGKKGYMKQMGQNLENCLIRIIGI